MRALHRVAASCLVLFALVATSRAADGVDGRVVQVEFPPTDITIVYLETSGAFSVQLDANRFAVSAQRLYLGDGKVAVELEARGDSGLFFQRTEPLASGHVLKKYDVVKVRPGYRRAKDLKPGDVYVILPGVKFELPAN